jgi:predicted Zn-dependent protease
MSAWSAAPSYILDCAVDATNRGQNASSMSRLLTVVTSLATTLTLVAGAAANGGSITANATQEVRRPVALVPLGSFPRSDAEALSRWLSGELGLAVRVLPRAAVPRSTFNSKRNQYVAEELIDVVAARRSAARPGEVLIGLTTLDMHTRAIPNWRFSFSIRHPSGLAVVSRARMDPAVLGLAPDPALRTRRLQKMVLKNVGLLALGLAESRNPRSALYDVILSTDDLDFMTEDFRPRTPSRAKRAWLARAGGVCERGVVEAKALIARSPVSTHAEILAFARESIDLEERSRVQLAASKEAPEDRGAFQRLLSLFAQAVRADRAAVARLGASWSDATIRAWATESVQNSLALKSVALELGSRECSRYFEPATYTR